MREMPTCEPDLELVDETSKRCSSQSELGSLDPTARPELRIDPDRRHSVGLPAGAKTKNLPRLHRRWPHGRFQSVDFRARLRAAPSEREIQPVSRSILIVFAFVLGIVFVGMPSGSSRDTLAQR